MLGFGEGSGFGAGSRAGLAGGESRSIGTEAIGLRRQYFRSGTDWAIGLRRCDFRSRGLGRGTFPCRVGNDWAIDPEPDAGRHRHPKDATVGTIATPVSTTRQPPTKPCDVMVLGSTG